MGHRIAECLSGVRSLGRAGSVTAGGGAENVCAGSKVPCRRCAEFCPVIGWSNGCRSPIPCAHWRGPECPLRQSRGLHVGFVPAGRGSAVFTLLEALVAMVFRM